MRNMCYLHINMLQHINRSNFIRIISDDSLCCIPNISNNDSAYLQIMKSADILFLFLL